jgi:outer membrane protein assembly factor BamD
MRSFLIIGLIGFLAACSGDGASTDALVEKQDTPEALYLKARTSFDEKTFVKSISEFEEVERQHPYSPWARRAQIMAAYAAYRAGKFDDAINIVDRFVQLYPTDSATPYAYYLRALSLYTQISDIGRDQQKTQLAREALREIVARYPNSNYARDAKLKLDLTDDHLAGKELEVGRYYLKQQEYLAAINRFKYVVEKYETTSHVAEALHRLVETNLRLGLVHEAKKYAAVLGHNYPGSEWYKFSYAMLKGNLSPEEKSSRFDGYLDFLPL